MLHNKGIKISPKYYQKDWTNLNLNANDKPNWDRAIEIFIDRIDGRYFKQIEILEKNNSHSGFVIMSICCLLIETLEQFWKGKIQNSHIQNNYTSKKSVFNFLFRKKSEETSNDALIYYEFFQRSENLSNFFDTTEKSNIFYSKIRCGLLHQGQTKGKSLIRTKNTEPLLKWINEYDINQGLIINRKKFVEEIKLVFNKYIEELRTNPDINFKKKTLKRKMDYIVNLK